MGISSSSWKPDISIPAEYILFKHYLGEPADAGVEAKIAAFIRRQQRRTTAGRCSPMAPSTSPAASRPILH